MKETSLSEKAKEQNKTQSPSQEIKQREVKEVQNTEKEDKKSKKEIKKKESIKEEKKEHVTRNLSVDYLQVKPEQKTDKSSEKP